MKHAMIPGRFMPLHNGHVYMIRSVMQVCEEVTVLVLCAQDDAISGERRCEWIQRACAGVKVVTYSGAVDPFLAETTGPWTHLAGSAAGLKDSANAADLKPLLIDPDLEALPVRSEHVRQNVFACWSDLPGVVKSDLALRVCVYGPESTGKSTLARMLASHYATVYMPEYGRIYDEQHRPDTWTRDEMIELTEIHEAMRRELMPMSNRVMIEDTDALLARVWCDALVGHVDPWFDQDFELADLYLVTDVDVPWVHDGLRQFGKDEERKAFLKKCVALLDERGARYHILSGDWHARDAKAIDLVDQLLKEAAQLSSEYRLNRAAQETAN